MIEEELSKMREQARLRQQQVIVQCEYPGERGSGERAEEQVGGTGRNGGGR